MTYNILGCQFILHILKKTNTENQTSWIIDFENSKFVHNHEIRIESKKQFWESIIIIKT